MEMCDLEQWSNRAKDKRSFQRGTLVDTQLFKYGTASPLVHYFYNMVLLDLGFV